MRPASCFRGAIYTRLTGLSSRHLRRRIQPAPFQRVADIPVSWCPVQNHSHIVFRSLRWLPVDSPPTRSNSPRDRNQASIARDPARLLENDLVQSIAPSSVISVAASRSWWVSTPPMTPVVRLACPVCRRPLPVAGERVGTELGRCRARQPRDAFGPGPHQGTRRLPQMKRGPAAEGALTDTHLLIWWLNERT